MKTRNITDSSGFGVFSAGDEGTAHVLAHELLDEGRFEEGRVFLNEWLADNKGEGSGWVHLQWHLAVFEISTGYERDAFARFNEHILPAVPFRNALTDGPSLLWRLYLCSGSSIDIDWEAVREAAAGAAGGASDPYVELHRLLAFAGSRDVKALDRWLDECSSEASSEAELTLLRMGWGVRTFATGDYGAAATLLKNNAPGVSQLGGSRAQNELFSQIAAEAEQRARESMPIERAA